MVNRTSVVDRFGLRKLVVLSVVILGLVAPSAASASITSVFGTVTCRHRAQGTGPALVRQLGGHDGPKLGRHADRRFRCLPARLGL